MAYTDGLSHVSYNMSEQKEIDILFALTGDVRRNSRALRQLRALAAQGFTIEVLTLGSSSEDVNLEPGIRARVLPHPAGSGPLFFGRVHGQFTREAMIPASVYHASDLYALPAMHRAAGRFGGRLTYDARELYPHVAATTGRPWIRLFWQSVERRFIRHADAVFTVSDGIADRLAATYGIPRPYVLHNVPPRRPVTRTDRLRNMADIPSDSVIVLHQGQMRKDRGCTRLVEAMQWVERAVLVFLGDGPERASLQELANALGVQDRVSFFPAVPPDELLDVTASADIGVTLLEDTCLNHRLALPNKLFEYVMAGLPVLASDLPEIRHVVKLFDIGEVVDPTDARQLAAVLQGMVDSPELRANWSKNTPNVLRAYSWEQESVGFVETFQRLAPVGHAQ